LNAAKLAEIVQHKIFTAYYDIFGAVFIPYYELKYFNYFSSYYHLSCLPWF